MKKSNLLKRILACVFAGVLIFGNGYGGISFVKDGNVSNVEAADAEMTLSNGQLCMGVCEFVEDKDSDDKTIYVLHIPSTPVSQSGRDGDYNLDDPNKATIRFNGGNYDLYMDAGTAVQFDIDTDGKEVYFTEGKNTGGNTIATSRYAPVSYLNSEGELSSVTSSDHMIRFNVDQPFLLMKKNGEKNSIIINADGNMSPGYKDFTAVYIGQNNETYTAFTLRVNVLVSAGNIMIDGPDTAVASRTNYYQYRAIPENTKTTDSYRWRTSDSSIASVSLVIGEKVYLNPMSTTDGTAGLSLIAETSSGISDVDAIKAILKRGTKTSKPINIAKRVSATSVSFKNSYYYLKMKGNSTLDLANSNILNVQPLGANDLWTFSLSNLRVAKFDEASSGILVPVAVGETKVRVESQENNVSSEETPVYVYIETDGLTPKKTDGFTALRSYGMRKNNSIEMDVYETTGATENVICSVN